MRAPHKRDLIQFGTDGWRAIIAKEFTFENLERVAQAYADYLESQDEKVAIPSASDKTETRLIVVGFDRRFLSNSFAECVAEVLAANGFRISLFEEPVPTPLVSWTVRHLAAAGGVVITASHNPPEFNGFKIKAPWGGSAAPKTTAAVESLVDFQRPKRVGAADFLNERERLKESVQSYRDQVAGYIDLDRLRKSSHKVIVDPMFGSAGRWVESFLTGSSLNVKTIRAQSDPLFGGINPEPIDRNLEQLKKQVTDAGALIGLATDGDADRVGAVNELGETMTMHEVVPLLLLHLARTRGMTGGVVRTFSQSVLTKRIASALGLRLFETPIGFKYIADLMLREDILLGAEESGGIGVKGHIPERDGVLNSLLLLEAVVISGKTPSDLVSDIHREFGEFYFGRKDLRVDVARGLDLVSRLAEVPPSEVGGFVVNSVETIDGTKLSFEDESWLLFRQSGTEPALRIYCEATSVAKMNSLLTAGEQILS